MFLNLALTFPEIQSYEGRDKTSMENFGQKIITL